MSNYKYFKIGPGTTPEDLKKQYHKLSVQLHPDKSGGDHNKFVEMVAEYNTIAKALKQKAYDNKDFKSYKEFDIILDGLINKIFNENLKLDLTPDQQEKVKALAEIGINALGNFLGSLLTNKKLK